MAMVSLPRQSPAYLPLISTSLIQRKLSLGYGRAAKLIDRMEELGYVSAPEGQKPREVLITKQEYMELVLHDADIQ